MNGHDKQAWFCLRSQPKHEHIAAANLKRLREIEVFSPRLRSRKLTRNGPAWFTESLFPNYLFARFRIEVLLNEVRYTPGISHVVHFADRYPTVPDAVIDELQQAFGKNELHVTSGIPGEGDRVLVADQALLGMEAVVLRVLPARQRIEVLIEMLGRASKVELPLSSVVPFGAMPPELLSSHQSGFGQQPGS